MASMEDLTIVDAIDGALFEAGVRYMVIEVLRSLI